MNIDTDTADHKSMEKEEDQMLNKIVAGFQERLQAAVACSIRENEALQSSEEDLRTVELCCQKMVDRIKSQAKELSKVKEDSQKKLSAQDARELASKEICDLKKQLTDTKAQWAALSDTSTKEIAKLRATVKDREEKSAKAIECERILTIKTSAQLTKQITGLKAQLVDRQEIASAAKKSGKEIETLKAQLEKAQENGLASAKEISDAKRVLATSDQDLAQDDQRHGLSKHISHLQSKLRNAILECEQLKCSNKKLSDDLSNHQDIEAKLRSELADNKAQTEAPTFRAIEQPARPVSPQAIDTKGSMASGTQSGNNLHFAFSHIAVALVAVIVCFLIDALQNNAEV